MPKDRALDRHAKPGQLIRLSPPDLWERLGEREGERGRSPLISELVTRYLDGRPMPDRPWLTKNSDKTGSTTKRAPSTVESVSPDATEARYRRRSARKST